MSAPRVALVSLEPWDQVWRRNQHLVAELIAQQLVGSVLFIEPPAAGRAAPARSPLPGVTVIRPVLPVPRRTGGLSILAGWLRRRWLRDVDVLWINDPVLGARCAAGGSPRVLYDVTDDWRFSEQPARLTRRLVAAEDRLATTAVTVVCSDVLADRWSQRYGVTATVVHNAATQPSYAEVRPRPMAGNGLHVGYVGTLHEDRLDIDLLLRIAAMPEVGTIHLVGPDAMSAPARDRLAAVDTIRRHGAVPSIDVPSWLVAMDVLVLPHVVSEFTLSLDAIKAFEYLAAGRPIVATPTSGFQDLTAPGLRVVDAAGFPDAVAAALTGDKQFDRTVPTWEDRAREFALALNGPAA
jgi:teichuronic acid biosynthesis glycosyltransferase TuaH